MSERYFAPLPKNNKQHQERRQLENQYSGVIIGGIAVLAGVVSAIAMAYCEPIALHEAKFTTTDDGSVVEQNLQQNRRHFLTAKKNSE
jgi:hypothetical protein